MLEWRGCFGAEVLGGGGLRVWGLKDLKAECLGDEVQEGRGGAGVPRPFGVEVSRG